MQKIKTKDNQDVTLAYSRFRPDMPQDGMAPAMAYLWIQNPVSGQWIKTSSRSSLQLKNIIESNNLEDLVFFIDNDMV